MKTLPDYLRPGLDIVSIGINPSLPSVERGFYFANPRNRFWRALNASRLVDVPLDPGMASQQQMMIEFGIGFTDLVKRPSASAKALKAPPSTAIRIDFPSPTFAPSAHPPRIGPSGCSSAQAQSRL